MKKLLGNQSFLAGLQNIGTSLDMIPPLQATTSLFALSIFTLDWFYNSATKSTLFCCATSIARSQYLLESFQHAHLSLGAPTFHDACDLADQF